MPGVKIKVDTAESVAKTEALKKSFDKLGDSAQKTAKQTDGFSKALKQAMGFIAVGQLTNMLKDVALAGARYETLGVSMNVVGKTAGYSTREMENFSKALQSTGISMSESRQSLLQMTQAQLDLSKSTELARVAQDAAVIGQMNSSEAFNNLVYGIQSANTVVLRTMGINISFEDSYKRVAAATGRSAVSFSKAEEAEIRLNAVLEYGKRIAGTYEAAMNTAGKQLSSFTRYIQNFKVEMGQAFNPATALIIETATKEMKEFTKEITRPDVQEALAGMGKTTADTFKNIISFSKAAGGMVFTILEGWNQLPPLIQQVGLLAAVAFGAKGVAAFAGISLLEDWVGLMGQAIDLANKGKVSWSQIAGAGDVKELRALVANTTSKNPLVRLESQEAKLKKDIENYEREMSGIMYFGETPEKLKKAREDLKKIQEEKKIYTVKDDLVDSHGVGRFNSLKRKAMKDEADEKEKALKASEEAKRVEEDIFKIKLETRKIGKGETGKALEDLDEEVRKMRKAGADENTVHRYTAAQKVQIYAKAAEEMQKSDLEGIEAGQKARDEIFDDWLQKFQEAEKLEQERNERLGELALVDQKTRDQTPEETKNKLETAKAMYEGMKGYEKDYYAASLSLLNISKDQQLLILNRGVSDYEEILKNRLLVDEWYEEQKKQLQYNAAVNGDDFIAGALAEYQKMEDEKLRMGRAGAELMKGVFSEMRSSFSEIFYDSWTGKLKSAEDYFKSFANSIAKMWADTCSQMITDWLRQQMITGITKIVGAAVSYGAGAGASGFGGESAPSSGWGGGDGGFGGGNYQVAQTGHTGGVIGEDRLPLRLLPDSYFVNAPRYHSGIGPGEQAAVIKDDEGVFTQAQMKAMGKKSEVKVEIANIVSPEMFDSYMSTTRGQNAVMNVISGRGGTLKRVIQMEG